ncbi:hypothetical protein HK096_009006 [Nowakowskiella sp. JEL0078]|nr:hypothetical protein HK096_009006 [Nowakowskiella sp. JEL0078]
MKNTLLLTLVALVAYSHGIHKLFIKRSDRFESHNWLAIIDFNRFKPGFREGMAMAASNLFAESSIYDRCPACSEKLLLSLFFSVLLKWFLVGSLSKESFAKIGKLSFVGDVGTAPRTPIKFPSTTQSVLISGTFLQDPLVTDALAIVNKVVPAMPMRPLLVNDGPTVNVVNGSNVIQNPSILRTLDVAGHQIDGDVDDRVRAIANELGYHMALWNQDSRDADVTANTANGVTVLNTITSWFNLGTSFVSLEHDISTFTNQIAVNALQQIQKLKAVGTPIKFSIQPQLSVQHQWL